MGWGGFVVRRAIRSPRSLVYSFIGLLIHAFPRLLVYVSTGLLVYRFTCLLFPASTRLRVHGFTRLPIYLSTFSRVDSSTGLPVYSFTGSLVYSFPASTASQLSAHGREDLGQLLDHAGPFEALADHGQNGVVARDRAAQAFGFVRVDFGRDARGIARPGAHHHQVARELHAQETRRAQKLRRVDRWCQLTNVGRVLGQHIAVAPVARNLGRLQLLEVARERGLRHFVALCAQEFEEFFLAPHRRAVQHQPKHVESFVTVTHILALFVFLSTANVQLFSHFAHLPRKMFHFFLENTPLFEFSVGIGRLVYSHSQCDEEHNSRQEIG